MLAIFVKEKTINSNDDDLYSSCVVARYSTIGK